MGEMYVAAPTGLPPVGVRKLMRRKGAHQLDPRALAVLQSIDWRAKRIVLWVPGTSEQNTPAGIRQAFDSLLAGVPFIRVPYMQTWDMRTSVPDGVRVLSDVLRGIAELRAAGSPTPEVLMAGHSQGSWVASEVLASLPEANVVTRTILFANPGTHATHFPGFGPTTTPQTVTSVLELSSPHDPVSRPTKNTGAALDVVGGASIARRALGVLKILVSDPGYGVAMLRWQLGHLLNKKYDPGADPISKDPHQYTTQAKAGVLWLRGGSPKALGYLTKLTPGWQRTS